MSKLTINGQERTATGIAYDTCHKIYLINNDEAKAEAVEYGYTIHEPTAVNLLQIWANACPLKFIQMWDGFDNVIPQAFEGRVEIS